MTDTTRVFVLQEIALRTEHLPVGISLEQLALMEESPGQWGQILRWGQGVRECYHYIVPTTSGMRLHSRQEPIAVRGLQEVQHAMGDDEIEGTGEAVRAQVFGLRIYTQAPRGSMVLELTDGSLREVHSRDSELALR